MTPSGRAAGGDQLAEESGVAVHHRLEGELPPDALPEPSLELHLVSLVGMPTARVRPGWTAQVERNARSPIFANSCG